MRKFDSKLWFIVLFSAIGLVNLNGQSVNDVLRFSEQGILSTARSLSMGNAYSVWGNDFSSVRFNPATLARDTSLSFLGSIYFNAYIADDTLFNSPARENKFVTSLGQFGLSVPFKIDDRVMVIALGYTQTNNFNRVVNFLGFNQQDNSRINYLTAQNSPITNSLGLSYSEFDPANNDYLGERTLINGNLQQSGTLLEDGSLNNWSLAVSYEFVPNVFFGGSVNYVIGGFNSDKDYFETDTENFYDNSIMTVPGDMNTAGFQRFHLSEIRNQAFNGWDFRFGVLYKFFDFIAIGGAAKFPTTMKIDEIQSVSGFSEFETGRIIQYQPAEKNIEYSLKTPYEFSLAASVNIFFITAAAEATYIDYTQMEYTDGLSLQEISSLNKEIRTKMRRTINLRGGAEFRLPFTGLSARAGFILNTSPYADADLSMAKKYLTAGLGIASVDKFRFDIGYALGFWDSVYENYGEGLSTVKEGIISHNLMTSVKLMF